MKIKFVLLLCVFAVLAVALTRQAANASATQKTQLTRIYAQLFEAVAQPGEAGYLSWLQRYCAPDWIATDATGKLHTRAEQIQAAKAVMSGHEKAVPPSPDIEYAINQIDFHGNNASVTWKQHFTGAGKNSGGMIYVTDHWQDSNGHWRCLSSRSGALIASGVRHAGAKK